MKPFEESDRYEYPDLTKDSLVIDAGGYEGNWAAAIHNKYGCNVMIFEPVKKFYEAIRDRFQGVGDIGVNHCGLGGADCGGGKTVLFHVQNDSTGVFAGSSETEEVRLFSARYVIGGIERGVDLLKLNVEGMEFDILDSLCDSGLIRKVKNVQVQWHAVLPDSELRYSTLQNKLSLTHELTFDAGWVWQNWKLKS